MDKVKTGILGLNAKGKFFAKLLIQEIAEAELIAASGKNLNDLEFFEDKLGIKQVYVDHKELLALNELDAIIITSDVHLHAMQSIEAVESGLHVFLERPIALNVADSKRVIERARRNPSQTLFPGFSRRFDPRILSAKKMLDKGEIGELVSVRTSTSIEPLNPSQKAEDHSLRGGLFMEIGIDDIDLCHWFTGSKVSNLYVLGGAYVNKKYRDLNDADHAVAICQFENNTTAQLQFSRNSQNGFEHSLELIGSKGTISVFGELQTGPVQLKKGKEVSYAYFQTEFDRFKEAYRKQFIHFFQCISRGRKCIIKPEEALEATRISVAMTKSFVLKNDIRLDN